jgi:hypothetical protein
MLIDGLILGLTYNATSTVKLTQALLPKIKGCPIFLSWIPATDIINAFTGVIDFK